MDLRWYAARVRPLAEYAARDHLNAAGVEAFLPCVQTSIPRRGHRDAPLFPGYLFVRYDLKAWGGYMLKRVPQLVGLVALGGMPPPVPDEVIAELSHRVEVINGTGGLWAQFRPGDRVRVILGPEESLAEVVEGAKSPKARVRVLLDFLGRLVAAEVPLRDVQPLGSHWYAVNSYNRPSRRTRGGGRWIRGYGPRAIEAASG